MDNNESKNGEKKILKSTKRNSKSVRNDMLKIPNWLVEIQVLQKCEEVLKDRLLTTTPKIHQAETIEERLSLGMYMAYEELLEEVQHKLGRGILD